MLSADILPQTISVSYGEPEETGVHWFYIVTWGSDLTRLNQSLNHMHDVCAQDWVLLVLAVFLSCLLLVILGLVIVSPIRRLKNASAMMVITRQDSCHLSPLPVHSGFVLHRLGVN